MKVVGGRESIPRMAVRYNVDQIVLAIPSSKKDQQDILSICAKTGCQLKTVPSLYEIIESHSDSVSIRDVDIIDLLGRDEIKLNVDEICDYLKREVRACYGRRRFYRIRALPADRFLRAETACHL